MRRFGVGAIVTALALAACAEGSVTPAPTASPPVRSTAPTVAPSPVPPTGSASPGSPSPDEARAAAAGLALVQQVDGVGQVFLVNSGGEAVQLTNLEADTSWGGATSLAWAPDASRLAFDIGTPVGVSVGVVAVDGGDVLLIEGAALPSWSPDGEELAVGEPFDVIGPGAENDLPVSLVDPETGERSRVTAGILTGWHPDGRIVVLRSVGASETTAGTPVVIAVDVESGAEEEILRGATGTTWSADGRRIAFIADAPETCPPDCHEILVADGDDLSDAVVIGPGTGARWSPDGEILSFATLDDGPSHVVLMELATGSRMDLGPGDASSVAWSARGDRVAYVFYLPDGTPAIRIVDRAGHILVELPGQAPAWQPAP